MPEINFPIFISLIKYIFFHQIYILLINFFAEFNFINNELITSSYPSCLQIDDNTLFLSNKDGMFFGDLNLVQTAQFLNISNNDINYETFLEKLIIAKYDDYYGGDIICIINNNIYAFGKNDKKLKFFGPINNEAAEAVYLNLVPYKIDENNNYHFFIINRLLSNSIYKLLIMHFQNNQTKSQVVSHLKYRPFYLDYTGIRINSDYFTCQIMNSEQRGDVLTCAYFAYDNRLIVVQSFDIENDIQEIEEYYSKFPIDNLDIITSTISPDKKNILICYSPSNKYGYCFTYNFDTNKISNHKPVIEKCDNKYAFFKLNYFPQTQEYVFACRGNQEKFTIVKFDKNFTKINPDEITSENFVIQNYYCFNSISLIYDKTEQKYMVVADSKELNESPLVTRRFPVTTNFSESFESTFERPAEFEEKYEHDSFIIDENNKYYVFTNNFNYYANSRDHRKLKINFIDENILIAYTRDNKTINTSLYSIEIRKTSEKGRLVVDIDGEEKEIKNFEKIANVSEIFYYPEFGVSSDMLFFSLTFYLKNNTLASLSPQIIIYICKENCTCDKDHTFCGGCLEDFEVYKYDGNCIGKNDLNGKFLKDGIYYDCFKMCKTCSGISSGLPNMNCLSCYIEHGDYQEDDNCYEKYCENLFYWDKDTGMKTCLNESECPDDYPFIKEGEKECKKEKIEETSKISETSNTIEEDGEKIFNYIMKLIDEEIGTQNLQQINKTYSLLSNAIIIGNFSSFKKDITISGENITYQLTTSENQKNANHKSNVSVIDLGECEKIIKRNISYEDDPTPLLILKIDVKKTKSTAVEYEVYNPYTKQKIDLSICSNTTIAIYSPVELSSQENSLYNNLNEQGYDLFDVNNSFYLDPCCAYTSENGTDLSLKDRKNYFYNKDIVLCEDTCKYIKYYTENSKAYCQCTVKSNVNVDSNQEFTPQTLLEKFYKVDTYANFEILYCYKLVFSSKGLKENICFYILLILLVSFLTSMIINLFSAIKNLEQIIFKIFQDRFMFYFMQKIISERRRRNVRVNGNQQNENNNK